MAFPDLEQRFNTTMNQLYAKYSTGDSVEFKPNSPDRENVNSDSRTIPLGSVERDVTRIGSFLKSGLGLKWIALQQLLQTGNAISETRQFNPLEILGNLVPYLHIRRSLRTQASDILSNPQDLPRSPASTPSIGKAGRLQIETSNDAKSNLGASSLSIISLINALSPSALAQVLSSTFSFGDGTLDVNQRPELDIDGNYYSVIKWTGYKALANEELAGVIGVLQTVGANLTNVGVLGLKLPAIVGSIGGFISGVPQPINPIDGAKGQRYFITDSDQAIRYITNVKALDRYPYILRDPKPNTQTGLSNLTIPDSALENQYASNPSLQFTRTNLQKQILDGTTGVPDYTLRGIQGGLNQVNTTTHPIIDSFDLKNLVDGLAKRADGVNAATAVARPGYYFDALNAIGVVNGQDLPEDANFKDYIKVGFLDVVNNKYIPFRAILNQMSETTNVNYSDIKYIGRIERNIIYEGAVRNLQFTLTVAVFSPTELQPLWEKINYLTGLGFPSTYSSDGFLVPPVVKLTIGNYYVAQPGYINSLTHTLDENITWEVEPGFQVPKYIDIGISFVVIEKDAMTSKSSFYGFGQTIPTA